mmetsp:Transcript_55648/g.124338  ORF Transcript_55648/g.124338 Transcript_55648/m.124338 type:complete len:223 (+) Transcript_55648:155-823(+)
MHGSVASLEPLGHRCEFILEVVRPARQWRTPEDEVVRRPLNAPVVHCARRLAVLADDVERRARADRTDQLIDDLLGLPRPALRPLLRRIRAVLHAIVLALVLGTIGLEVGSLDPLVATRADHCVDAPGHQQEGVHLAAGSRAQLVLQRLRENLDAGLAHVVRRVARWHRDALLRARVHHDRWLCLLDHVWHKREASQENTPQVGLQDCAPSVGVFIRAAPVV